MSNIPNSAMPRAKAPSETEGKKGGKSGEKSGSGASIKKQAGKIADKARGNPKTAIAAGAVVAGAIAAAAIPLVRGAVAKKSSKKGEASGGAKKKKD
jgi:hypothetical protein